MRAGPIIVALTLTLLLPAQSAFADSHVSGYSAGDLLSPCQESDNDARWGEYAEMECEQFIIGFVGALRQVGAKAELGICAPEQNTADEVRWAFMRWVHEDYSARIAMPASDALMATLRDRFACG